TDARRGGELRRTCKNVTIAGQTAPGDGICIVGDKVNLGGSENLIIRHVRFRAGAMENHSDGKGSLGIENARNWIIDHCTFGWSGEENMTIYDNHNTTIQWCIIHEGLYDAGHGKGVRGYGAQWGGQNATFHNHLPAHTGSRSPSFNVARSNDLHVLIDYVNNVNYNWGKQNSCYGSDIGLAGGTNRTNFVNNYYKPGPARLGDQNSYFSESTYGGAEGCVAQWYMSGNIMEGTANADKNTDNYLGLNMDKYAEAGVVITEADYKSPVPFPIPEPYRVQAETAEQAYRSVLAGAGAFPRDAVDRRVVEETASGTARFNGRYDPDGTHRMTGIIDTPADAGGYPVYRSSDAPVDSDHDGIPDYWEELYGLNPNDPSDGAQSTLSGRTYTNLEVYLHELSQKMIGNGNYPQP
ncbi:MAG: pectate lyase, partial [Rikenellaceae bacterium]|nr:pectate lyase [Rikenellaceae bacterium]